MNILITGLPQSGKTTLLKTILADFPRKTGFFTNEIREGGVRTGFELETSAWEKSVFASTFFETDRRIGKYGVDISSLERAIPSLLDFTPDDMLFIDEIGPMEFIPPLFQAFCISYLDAPNLCIALSQVYVNDFTEAIKNRNDTVVFELTPENRDEKMREIYIIIERQKSTP